MENKSSTFCKQFNIPKTHISNFVKSSSEIESEIIKSFDELHKNILTDLIKVCKDIEKIDDGISKHNVVEFESLSKTIVLSVYTKIFPKSNSFGVRYVLKNFNDDELFEEILFEHNTTNTLDWNLIKDNILSYFT